MDIFSDKLVKALAATVLVGFLTALTMLALGISGQVGARASESHAVAMLD